MTLEIRYGENAITGILAGRLDTVAAVQFAKDIEALTENADKKIILDCSQLEFISSSGLRLFLTLRKATLAKGGKVVVKGISKEIKKVFTITGFSSLFDFE